MKSLLNILAISLIFALVSCEKQENFMQNSTDGKVSIRLKCTPLESTGSTKALDQIPNEGLATGYMVKDYWILQYTSDGDYIDKSAQYIVVEDNQLEYWTPVILPKEDEEQYCLFIANTHNPVLDKEFEQYKGTLSEMTKFYKGIQSLDQTYNAAENDLVMSGVALFKFGDTELNCKLYRNIAKVTIELNNCNGSDLTIKSINIRNVPAGALYADALYKYQENENSPLPGIDQIEAPFPNSHSISFIDYELDALNVPENTVKTLEWYLPRNFRGNAAEAVSADLKNKFAPELATFIEIFATTSNGDLFRYRFYLGKNASSNFDVEPNKHYRIPIKFIDKGNVLDSRVTDYSAIELSNNSNCFIINPLPGIEQTIYRLPVDRVNQFWSSASAPAGEDHTIKDGTNWIAEVIWQDQPQRIISFIDDSGNEVDQYAGAGFNPFKFKVSSGAKGNVLVGVKKEGETKYLWSWHLWITDYNPNECSTPWVTDKYVYYVTGGQVHRYAGDFWETNYKDKYIMDRNLGALSTNRAEGLEKTGGFVYQFGRKDPIPASNIVYNSTNVTDYTNYKLYDINGNVKSFSNDTENPLIIDKRQAYIYESVNNPFTFFATNKSDWIINNIYANTSYSWNGNRSGEKSMFDPCPDGWMVPKAGVWSIFGERESSNVNRNENFTGYKSKTAGVEFYIDANIGGEHKEYNIAYIPALGSRYATDGGAEGYETKAYLHTTQKSTNDSKVDRWGFTLKSGNAVSLTAESAKYARSHALSVRCIRENISASRPEYNNNKNNEEYNQVPW